MTNNGKTYYGHVAASRALGIINHAYCEDHCGGCEGGESECIMTVAELKWFLESRKFTDLKPITEFAETELFEEDCDDNRYPSEFFLACLSRYDAWDILSGREGLDEFLGVIRSVWWCFPELWKYDADTDILEISTGGWSGNEDILSALSKTSFYRLCMEYEYSGGHVVFNLSKIHSKNKWNPETPAGE